MNKKKLYFPAFLQILTLFSITSSSLKSETGHFQAFDEVEFFCDDFVMDEEFNNSVLSRGPSFTPQEIVNFLITDLQMDKILQQNLYRYTNPANIRPLLDLPAYEATYPKTLSCDVHAGFIPFYTQTRKQYFTEHSPFLSEYLNFANPDFIDSFDQLFKYLSIDPKNFNIPDILSLFKNLKLEERRVGAIFSCGKSYENFEMGLQLPFYYLERNLFITKDEQDAIANQAVFQTLGSGSGNDKDVEAFIKQHVVGDLLGLGDLRFSFMWTTEKEAGRLAGGVELTLPSAAAAMDHLIAHHRCRSPNQPIFDIQYLVYQAELDNLAVEEYLKTLGIDSLDRLLQTCTDTKLGLERVSIAPRGEIEYAVTKGLSLAHMARFTVFLPANSVRFFSECKTSKDFARDWNDEAQASANLDFLSKRFINMLYPMAQNVRLETRFGFEYSLGLQFYLHRVAAEIGYNLWILSPEHLHFAEKVTNDLPLNLPAAESPAALQQKAFARFMWEHESCSGKLWHVGLVGDWTFAHSGIGRDWSLGLVANVLW